MIFKICPQEMWDAAVSAGAFTGAPIDLADGYIHFSTGAQAVETAQKHFARIEGLVLVAIDPETLGPDLRWEPSRGGALFPHLYADLSVDAAIWVKPLPLGDDGNHVFPEMPA